MRRLLARWMLAVATLAAVNSTVGVALAQAPSTAGPSVTQPTPRLDHERYALGLIDDLSAGPFAIAGMSAIGDNAVAVSFRNPALLQRANLDVDLVLTPFPAGDVARTHVEKRDAALTARSDAFREGWQPARGASVWQTGPAELTIDVPTYAARGRGDSVYVIVSEPTDASIPPYRSPPFRLIDLNPPAPGSASLSPWAWGPPVDTGRGERAPARIAVDDPPTLTARGPTLELLSPPIPDRVSGLAVTSAVDVVRVRARGLAETSIFDLRADERSGEMAAFPADGEAPLPRPAEVAPVSAPDGKPRWGAADYWRAVADRSGGGQRFTVDRATIEKLVGNPITVGTLVALGRDLTLEDGSVVHVAGTATLFANQAAGPSGGDAGSNQALSALGLTPTTLAANGGGAADSERRTAELVLVAVAVIGIPLLILWVVLAVRRSEWYQYRREHRRRVAERSARRKETTGVR